MKVSKFLSALSLLSATTLATSLVAGTASAAPTATCPDTGVTQTQVDLTVAGTTTTINGAIYESIDTNGSVGTGTFPALVRIQGSDCIQGYNTQGTEEFDTVNNSSEPILLSDMDVVTVGTTDYVEFHLDINQVKNNDGISGPSLDNVQIFVSQYDNLSNWDDCSLLHTSPDLTVNCVYDMDFGTNQAVLLDYVLNNGGGNGYDMKLLIPVSVFGAALADPSHSYVYLYSSFGAVGGVYTENDGFEEWQYRVCPAGTVCVREPDTNVPEPASIALIGAGLLALAARRGRRYRH